MGGHYTLIPYFRTFLHNIQAATCTLNRLHEEKWSRTWHACLLSATNRQMLKTAIRVSTLPSPLFLNVRYVILLCSPLFPQMFLAVGSACELSPSLQLAIANHTFIHFKFQYWNWGAEVIYKRSDEDFHTLSIFWEHCPINLHHSMSSWCPFLNTDHAIYHLNINVQLRRVTHLSRKRKKAHTT